MTIKMKHSLDIAWRCLEAACEKHGRMVSAGELAQEMGVSRNTAVSRLLWMVGEDAIVWQDKRRGKMWVSRFGIYGYTWNGKAE